MTKEKKAGPQTRVGYLERRTIKKSLAPIDHQQALSLCARYEPFCSDVIEVLIWAYQEGRLQQILDELEAHADRYPIMNPSLWIHRDFFKYLRGILSGKLVEKPY